MIAVDTNLLVYARRGAVPEHAGAVAALEAAGADPGGWGIPLPVVAEFWRVVTGPAAGTRPAKPDSVSAFLDDLWRAGARVLYPASGFERQLAAMAQRLDVRGQRIFDLQIALIAHENGVRELWTHDAGFVVVPGLRLRDPLAAR